jgi:hypothetical protein
MVRPRSDGIALREVGDDALIESVESGTLLLGERGIGRHWPKQSSGAYTPSKNFRKRANPVVDDLARNDERWVVLNRKKAPFEALEVFTLADERLDQCARSRAFCLQLGPRGLRRFHLI